MCFPCHLHVLHSIPAQSCLVLGSCGNNKGCRYIVDGRSTLPFLGDCQRMRLFPKELTPWECCLGRGLSVHVIWCTCMAWSVAGKSSKKYNGRFNNPRPRCQDLEVRRLSGLGAKCPQQMPEYQNTSVTGNLREGG
jgi:hypothetical protein